MIVHANIHMNYFGLNYPVQPFFIAVTVQRAVNSNTNLFTIPTVRLILTPSP